MFSVSYISNDMSLSHNGKEFDNMYGLNTYDYGARQYYPVTGRWDRMDPLCEKYYPTSPFAYCMNNPVRLIDPDGRDPGDFFYSLDAAAKDFGKYTNPKSIKENREYATSFYKMTNNKGEKGFSYTKPRQGGPDGVSSWTFISRDKKGNVKDSKSPTKEKAVATGHTHGAYKEYYGLGNDVFSGLKNGENKTIKDQNQRKDIVDNTKDIGSSNVAGIPDYVVTPAGTLQYYDPSTGKIEIKGTDLPKDEADNISIDEIKKYYE